MAARRAGQRRQCADETEHGQACRLESLQGGKQTGLVHHGQQLQEHIARQSRAGEQNMQRLAAAGEGKQGAAQSGKRQDDQPQYGQPDQVENEAGADPAEGMQNNGQRGGQDDARHGKHGKAYRKIKGAGGMDKQKA